VKIRRGKKGGKKRIKGSYWATSFPSKEGPSRGGGKKRGPLSTNKSPSYHSSGPEKRDEDVAQDTKRKRGRNSTSFGVQAPERKKRDKDLSPGERDGILEKGTFGRAQREKRKLVLPVLRGAALGARAPWEEKKRKIGRG